MENKNRASVNTDKIEESKRVVKSSKTIDITNGGAANIEEIASINRGIGNRIAEIREKNKISQSEFYSLLYPDSNEADSTKTKRMSEIEGAKAFEGTRGARLLDFGRLLFISQRFNVPLDYLLYGKTEQATATPLIMKEESANTQKEEPKNDYAYEDKEISIDYIINQLLGNFRSPVSKISAAFLNLFKYANISIVGNYDIDNFETPQSLCIEISPKCFSVKGRYIEEEGMFYSIDRCIDYFYPDIDGLWDDLEQIVYWDVRTTLIQHLLATACRQNEKHYFNPFMLLRSIYLKMKYGLNNIGYDEYMENSNIGYLSYFSITDITESKALREGILPLDPCEDAYLKALKNGKPLKNPKPPFIHPNYTDPLCCTLNCKYEKIPFDLRSTLFEF